MEKWDFNCWEIADFRDTSENDEADHYFDYDHEVPKFRRVLRELCNTNPSKANVEAASASGGQEHGENSEVCDQPSIRRSLWRNGRMENMTRSPMTKKSRLSTPNLRPINIRSTGIRRHSFLHRLITSRKASAVAKYNNWQSVVSDSMPKVHSMHTRQDSYKDTDFISTLRHYSPSISKRPINRLTKPSPFKLTEPPKKAVTSEFQSMAQQVLDFQTKTPQRFRSKPNLGRDGEISQDSKINAQKKIPILRLRDICSPTLLTKKRKRAVNCLSQKEMEEQEVEEMKRYQFHAQPFNAVIFQRGDVLPKPQPKPSTVVQPFHFLSDNIQTKTHEIEDKPFKFVAKTVPKGLFERPLGLPEIVPLPATKPQSPNFLRRSLRHRNMTAYSNSTTLALNDTNMSQASVASTVKWDPKPTQVKPFKFEQRDIEMMRRKAKKIQEYLEHEKRLREFRANPLPKLVPSGIPPKQAKPSTKPEPFQHQEENLEQISFRKQKWIQEVKEEFEKQKKMANFKAKTCTVTLTDPFIPQKNDHVLIETSDIGLKTEIRAKQRKAFDEYLKKKEEELLIYEKERQQMRENEEKEAVAALRASAVHHAQPIRQYPPIDTLKRLPLTTPASPAFISKKRLPK